MTLRARKHVKAGEWTEPAADRLVLGYDDRFRRRIRLTTESGITVLLDLSEATILQDGDGLVLDDGRVVAIAAAPEPLMEVIPGDRVPLARLAWHIGNRHLEAEIDLGSIRLRRDHVIRDMLELLGAQVRDVEAPFRPEGGAYGHGRTFGHDHGGHSHGGHSHGGHDYAEHSHGEHSHTHSLKNKAFDETTS